MLDLAGMKVVVISDRTQTADPMFFEMFGLDIGEAATVVVKSRGHFRAGYAHMFPVDSILQCQPDVIAIKGLPVSKHRNRKVSIAINIYNLNSIL